MSTSELNTSEKTSAELVDRHSEIWKLMELSSTAVAELNKIVVELSGQLARQRQERAETSMPLPAVKRADHELTREEYMERHRLRFTALGISESTQAELLDAAAFIWRAMHDASLPADQREVAETIREMMQAMGGPPPCCDDNVLELNL